MAAFINYYDDIINFLEDDIDVYEDEFDGAIAEMTSTSNTYNCSVCGKSYKTNGGLNRHTQKKHQDPVDDTFELSSLNSIIVKSVEALSKDMCLSLQRRDSFSAFIFGEEMELLSEIKPMYAQLVLDNNAEQFYTSYFGSCVLNSVDFFKGLPQQSSTMLATKVGENILLHFKKISSGSSSKTTNPTPIADREIAALQYLAGYVVKKMLKKARNSQNYSSLENQAVIAILVNSIAEDDTHQPLIHLLNRGGLTAVTDETFKIFYRAEEKFRAETEVDLLRKIDVKKMSLDLVNNVDVASYYNALVDSSGTDVADEIKQKLLDSMPKLYLRVRAYSLARDVTASKKSAESSKKSLRKDLKKKSTEDL